MEEVLGQEYVKIIVYFFYLSYSERVNSRVEYMKRRLIKIIKEISIFKKNIVILGG